MIRDKASGHEGWLRLLCLALSVGLHASLVAVSWQPPALPPLDRRPLTVVLVEKPAVTPALPVETATPARRPGVTAPAGSGAPPAVSPNVPAALAEPPVTVPEPAAAEEAAETVAPASEPSSPVAPGAAADGAESGSGAAAGEGLSRSGGGAGRAADTGRGLIKATPRYETNAMPPYPQLARQNRWEGTVRLRAKVTAGGVIETVTLERSSGYEVLDRAALDSVRQWRFIPATRGGVPVASEISFPVAFRLTE